MYNSYNEVALLKDLFTSKFEADKLYKAIVETKTSCLLGFFNITQIDKLKPVQIMKLMSDYKSEVMRCYGGKTKHVILQNIIDYCSNTDKIPEKPIMLTAKDLVWILSAAEYRVCDITALRRNRFKLSPKAKAYLLDHGTLTQIALFASELKDSDYGDRWKNNYRMIKFIKKPTVEMLEYYWQEKSYSDVLPVVDYYPVKLLLSIIESSEGRSCYDLIGLNDKRFGGLLSVYQRLCGSTMRQWDDDGYGIDETSDEELKNYAGLVDNNRELLKEYVKGRLLKE